MDKRSILNQITAIRVMLDNVEKEVVKMDEPPQCDHRNIKNLTTMGGPDKWECRDCGYYYEGE